MAVYRRIIADTGLACGIVLTALASGEPNSVALAQNSATVSHQTIYEKTIESSANPQFAATRAFPTKLARLPSRSRGGSRRTALTQHYYYESAPVIRPRSRMGGPSGVTSLATERDAADPDSYGGCLWGLERYNSVCP